MEKWKTEWVAAPFRDGCRRFGVAVRHVKYTSLATTSTCLAPKKVSRIWQQGYNNNHTTTTATTIASNNEGVKLSAERN